MLKFQKIKAGKPKAYPAISRDGEEKLTANTEHLLDFGIMYS